MLEAKSKKFKPQSMKINVAMDSTLTGYINLCICRTTLKKLEFVDEDTTKNMTLGNSLLSTIYC